VVQQAGEVLQLPGIFRLARSLKLWEAIVQERSHEKEKLETLPLERLRGDKLITMKQVTEILAGSLQIAYDRWSENHFLFVKHGGAVKIWEG
jgi:hypothetical protein